MKNSRAHPGLVNFSCQLAMPAKSKEGELTHMLGIWNLWPTFLVVNDLLRVNVSI